MRWALIGESAHSGVHNELADTRSGADASGCYAPGHSNSTWALVAKWADYQHLTTIAKKIGGPRVLLFAIAAGGAFAGKASEVGVKAVVRKARSIKRTLDARAEAAATSRGLPRRRGR